MKTPFAIGLLLLCAGLGLCAPYRQIVQAQTYYPQQPHYQAPTYQQPTYQQGYNYDSYKHNGYRQRVKFVKIATVAQINPAYTSAYSDTAYDSSTQVELVAEVRRLRALLDAQAIAAAVLARGGYTVPPPVYAPPSTVVPVQPMPYAPQPAVQPQPVQPGAPQPAAPAQPSPAQPPIPKGTTGGIPGLGVLMAKCASCHQVGHIAPDQRFTMLDAKGQLSPLNDKQKLRMLLKVYSGQMPPPNNIQGVQPVTDAEYAALVDLLQ